MKKKEREYKWKLSETYSSIKEYILIRIRECVICAALFNNNVNWNRWNLLWLSPYEFRRTSLYERFDTNDDEIYNFSR